MQTGVCFLILAMLLTPAVDGVAKTLAAEHTPMMIAFVRYFSAGLIALAAARATGRRIEIARGDRVGQVVRTALIMGAMTALITALGHGADGEGGRGLSDRADRLGAARHPGLARAADLDPARRLGGQLRRARRSCCGPRPGSSPAASSR